ncbi:hypothetical protein OF83DRAFT_1085830 [Amylostereum chailletii]|nr:hypothetical protein OF83DRAFT_1085830 [Amylostereum chailletii]
MLAFCPCKPCKTHDPPLRQLQRTVYNHIQREKAEEVVQMRAKARTAKKLKDFLESWPSKKRQREESGPLAPATKRPRHDIPTPLPHVQQDKTIDDSLEAPEAHPFSELDIGPIDILEGTAGGGGDSSDDHYLDQDDPPTSRSSPRSIEGGVDPHFSRATSSTPLYFPPSPVSSNFVASPSPHVLPHATLTSEYNSWATSPTWSLSDAEPGSDEEEPPAHFAPQKDSDDELSDDEIDVKSDPLFRTREALFSSDDDLDICGDILGDGDARAPAFHEDPLIRNAYISAFIMSAFHHITEAAVKEYLDSVRESLISTQRRTGLVIPGLSSMARTLRTALKRLRLDPDEYIVYYFICDICWFCHHPSELSILENSGCTREDCPGRLFTSKTMADGRVKRTPVKIVPISPPERIIQHYLLRPGKYDEYQHWRGEGDEPGPQAPIQPPQDGLDAFTSSSQRLSDIYDGWGWRSIPAGLECRRGGKWGVEDVDVHKINQRFVALPCGLVLIFNIDWYANAPLIFGEVASHPTRFQPMKRSREGSHSSGAGYLTIGNNPRQKRFLPEESILVISIPGPDEPTLEQLTDSRTAQLYPRAGD